MPHFWPTGGRFCDCRSGTALTTPRNVLDAGRVERERRDLVNQSPPFKCFVSDGRNKGVQKPLFQGTRAECEDFIADRVFRAMRDAWIDTLPAPLIRDQLRQLIALAGDDHG